MFVTHLSKMRFGVTKRSYSTAQVNQEGKNLKPVNLKRFDNFRRHRWFFSVGPIRSNWSAQPGYNTSSLHYTTASQHCNTTSRHNNSSSQHCNTTIQHYNSTSQHSIDGFSLLNQSDKLDRKACHSTPPATTCIELVMVEKPQPDRISSIH